MKEYPEAEELEFIEKFDLVNGDVIELIEYIRERWWPGEEYGIVVIQERKHHLSNKKCKVLELHTSGWSGNESIMIALQANMFFFPLYWWKSIVGGHYYFEIMERRERKKNQPDK